MHTEVTIIDALRDILIRIRFFSICIAVVVLIAAAHQGRTNLDLLNNRQVFDALDPVLYQRALQASVADCSDDPTIAQVN
ncbi:MAG: hypothetical protein ACHRHE_23865 [Tepidisphaerales bacterium]